MKNLEEKLIQQIQALDTYYPSSRVAPNSVNITSVMKKASPNMDFKYIHKDDVIAAIRKVMGDKNE